MLSGCSEIGSAEKRRPGSTELLLLTHQALLPRTGAQVQSLNLTLMTVTVTPPTHLHVSECLHQGDNFQLTKPGQAQDLCNFGRAGVIRVHRGLCQPGWHTTFAQPNPFLPHCILYDLATELSCTTRWADWPKGKTYSSAAFVQLLT